MSAVPTEVDQRVQELWRFLGALTGKTLKTVNIRTPQDSIIFYWVNPEFGFEIEFLRGYSVSWFFEDRIKGTEEYGECEDLKREYPVELKYYLDRYCTEEI